MIDAFASQVHYLDHLAPIWQALPVRGTFFVTPQLVDHATFDVQAVTRMPDGGPIMVASMIDHMATNPRTTVFVEHGAGQTYSGQNGAYAGGIGRSRVALFICPSERVADRNRAAYPGAAVAVVGCPKLDAWLGVPHTEDVAISFHWNCPTAPESLSAFDHYAEVLPDLARAFPGMIGHAHPRIFAALAPIYAAAGIQPVREFSEVLHRAGVYALDNSSTMYEFAALGRPVVVLNTPWYRRNVEHGLRFWAQADVGIQVEEPQDLEAAIRSALADADPMVRLRREEIAREVFGVLDGHAADRAAQAIGEMAWT